MLKGGVPVKQISIASLMLVAFFLVSSVVFTLTDHPNEGSNALATATGIAIGTGATTGIVAANEKRKANGSGDTPGEG